MAKREFGAYIINVKAGTGKDPSIVLEFSIPHVSVDGSVLAGWLMEARRQGHSLMVTLESSLAAQLGLFDASADAITIELEALERDNEGEELDADDLPEVPAAQAQTVGV